MTRQLSSDDFDGDGSTSIFEISDVTASHMVDGEIRVWRFEFSNDRHVMFQISGVASIVDAFGTDPENWIGREIEIMEDHSIRPSWIPPLRITRAITNEVAA